MKGESLRKYMLKNKMDAKKLVEPGADEEEAEAEQPHDEEEADEEMEKGKHSDALKKFRSMKDCY